MNRFNGKHFVGISHRVNLDGRDPMEASSEIYPLWQEWGKHIDRIKDRIDGTGEYAIYHQYKSNHLDEYTITICVQVNNKPEEVPSGLTYIEVPEQIYEIIPVSGQFPQSLGNAWKQAWGELTPDRAFTYDIESYPANFNGQDVSNMTLYIAVK